MSKPTLRRTTPRDRDTVEHRLARLLDGPHLARVVPLLAPETLHRLVLHRGLEACGELVTAATPAQLTALLDLDLWHGERPGGDERFDVDRFGEWLEVLVEVGEEAAARTVAALDESVVVAGLCRYVRVFDPGTFEPVAQSDDEAVERSDLMNSEGGTEGLECEVGGYLVRGRRTDAWDAVVALLTALDTAHHRAFQALMQGCRRLSNSLAEVDGLEDLLSASEQHLYDVALERERRRSRLGYATPADARAFLALARQPHEGIGPVAAAYFRAMDDDEMDGAPGRAPAAAPAPGPRPDTAEAIAGSPHGEDAAAPLDSVLALLAEADVLPQRARAPLEAADGAPRSPKLALLRRGIEYVLRHDEAAYVRRTRELAFLANVLVAGCSLRSRPFTPQEASDAAASICNLGLETWRPGREGADLDADRGADLTAEMPPEEFLVDHDLVAAFAAGWSVLHREVSLFAADQLLATLAGLRGAGGRPPTRVDAATRRGLRTLERELARQRAAGTPWHAREYADVLATLDRAAWRSVVGLLGECPVLPAALTAALGGRTTSVNSKALEFISTTAQTGDVRAYMKLLPGLLSR